MKRSSLKLIVKLINDSKRIEISVQEVSDKLNISEEEVSEIFKFLINLDKVINLKSKTDFEIAKKGRIDIQQLIAVDNNLKNRRLSNKLIITIITIASFMIYIIVEWESISVFFNNIWKYIS